jgi:hypothetical protein
MKRCRELVVMMSRFGFRTLGRAGRIGLICLDRFDGNFGEQEESERDEDEDEDEDDNE